MRLVDSEVVVVQQQVVYSDRHALTQQLHVLVLHWCPVGGSWKLGGGVRSNRVDNKGNNGRILVTSIIISVFTHFIAIG